MTDRCMRCSRQPDDVRDLISTHVRMPSDGELFPRVWEEVQVCPDCWDRIRAEQKGDTWEKATEGRGYAEDSLDHAEDFLEAMSDHKVG